MFPISPFGLCLADVLKLAMQNTLSAARKQDHLTMSIQTETGYIQHPTCLLQTLKHQEDLHPKKRRKIII